MLLVDSNKVDVLERFVIAKQTCSTISSLTASTVTDNRAVARCTGGAAPLLRGQRVRHKPQRLLSIQSIGGWLPWSRLSPVRGLGLSPRAGSNRRPWSPAAHLVL